MVITAAHLRLTGVLGRRRRREWAQWVRKAIVRLVVPLVCAGEVLIAGGEPLSASGFLSDGVGTVPLSIRTEIEFIKC